MYSGWFETSSVRCRLTRSRTLFALTYRVPDSFTVSISFGPDDLWWAASLYQGIVLLEVTSMDVTVMYGSSSGYSFMVYVIGTPLFGSPVFSETHPREWVTSPSGVPDSMSVVHVSPVPVTVQAPWI